MQRRALDELYRTHAPRIRALCRRLLRNDAEAEDALHDAFVEACVRSSEFDGARASELTWLNAIARGRCLDRLRKRRTHARLDSLHVVEEPQSGDASEGPDRAVLCRALATLPAIYRDLLALAYAEDLSHSEIALRTGLPLGTVKTRLRAGLARLGQAVATASPDAPRESSGAAGAYPT